MWQTKDLREGIFGSVAMIGLTVRFLGSVAKKGLRRIVEEAEICMGVKGAKGREAMESSAGQDALRVSG